MPELAVHRKTTAPPPMVCMYCGAPATSKREWREENHKPIPGGGGGGTDPTPPPTGDDPVSAAIAVLLLPFALWQLLVAAVAGIGAVVGFIINRPAAPPAPASPPQPPPTTLVVVTTCDRHRHFHRRFWWAWLGVGVALAGLWAWAVAETMAVMGTENVDLAVALSVTAVFATILLPVGVGTLRFFHGPVIVDRVTEGTVVLDRVRQAYFDATGLKADNAA